MAGSRYHHIPPCGGLHSPAMESYCHDCLNLRHQRTMEILVENLAEYQGMEPPRPRPRPVYVPATESKRAEPKGGMNIEPTRRP